MISRFKLPIQISAVVLIIFTLNSCSDSGTNSRKYDFSIALHGGAGTILRENLTEELESEYRAKLLESLKAGYSVLEQGGSSLDAVTTTVTIMEDSPLFNAGRGAVFTNNGLNELDALIMDGKTLKAGAVGAIRNIKNPINLARLVMEKTWHVMLIGEGAKLFAEEQGVEMVPDEYFFTDRRWRSLQKALEEDAKKDRSDLSIQQNMYLGTVGVVALDKEGNLAAGTSTGGLTNKMYGRVGDSPIIGAGTYANNATCAVSGTGQGEYFMRGMVAYDVSAMMEYGNMSLSESADKVIHTKLTGMGGTGGIVALDHSGNVAMSFNTPGMYRGYYQSGKEPVIKIFSE